MNRTIHNPILKDTVTFVRTAAETAGAMTELEAIVMPSATSPPHFHTTYDETITALEGKILLLLANGAGVELAPRESYTIKAGQVHGLRNVSDEVVRVRSQIVPRSKGFEDGLRILYGLASDGLYNDRKMPASFQAFAICLAMSATKLPDDKMRRQHTHCSDSPGICMLSLHLRPCISDPLHLPQKLETSVIGWDSSENLSVL